MKSWNWEGKGKEASGKLEGAVEIYKAVEIKWIQYSYMKFSKEISLEIANVKSDTPENAKLIIPKQTTKRYFRFIENSEFLLLYYLIFTIHFAFDMLNITNIVSMRETKRANR